MRALHCFDAWIAPFDDAHRSSDRTNAFIAQTGAKIASCPLVEKGVVCVMTSPHYSRCVAPAIQQVRERLHEACNALDHAFWPDEVSLRDDSLFNFGRVQGHNQMTDPYLLALAVRHGGCLVSFDQAIVLTSVYGATPEQLMLL